MFPEKAPAAHAYEQSDGNEVAGGGQVLNHAALTDDPTRKDMHKEYDSQQCRRQHIHHEKLVLRILIIHKTPS
jgi:hypothetical protein